jgi:BolA protein
MPETTTRAERVRATLDRDFAPVALEIVDESHRHAGHAGAAAAGETHYAVLLVSDQFAGQSLVARHRRVNAALAPEFATGLHALSLTLRTPAEQAAVPDPGVVALI